MTAVDARRADRTSRVGLPFTRLAELWAAGTGIAVLLVASAYLTARELADPLVVAGGEVSLGNVTGFTVFGASVGAALALAIRRFSRKPRSTFLVATLIALAGYAVVPFTAAESIATALWLNLFHLVVAVPVVGMLARWLPRDQGSDEA